MLPDIDVLKRRQLAYRSLFLKQEVNDLKWWQKPLLSLLPDRYSKVGMEDLTWEGQTVLEDLVNFCNMNESDFDTDVGIMAFQCGKREVMQRILANLHIELGDVVSVPNNINQEETT